jgi:hypothetical protein
MYLPDLTPNPLGAFDQLARESARGIEIDSNRVILILAASGRSMPELEAAVDRLLSEPGVDGPR